MTLIIITFIAFQLRSTYKEDFKKSKTSKENKKRGVNSPGGQTSPSLSDPDVVEPLADPDGKIRGVNPDVKTHLLLPMEVIDVEKDSPDWLILKLIMVHDPRQRSSLGL